MTRIDVDSLENFEEEQQTQQTKQTPRRQAAPARRTTRQQKAKQRRIRKIALTALLVASISLTGAYVVAPAIENAKETRRAESLVSAYYENGVVTLPEVVTSERSYDVTVSSGEKLRNRLEKNNNDILCVNGTYYTPEGVNLVKLQFQVAYAEYINATVVNTDGTTIYVAPQGYTLTGRHAYKIRCTEEYRIVPEADDYSNITIDNAYQYCLVGVVETIPSLPYSELDNKTLICDVPDGASLNEQGVCTGNLELAPKKR